MGGLPRVASLALAALFAFCTGSLSQPAQPPVEVSPYLLRLSARAVVDFGAGVIEAEGVSTRVEAPPAIQAAREARTDALGRLRDVLPLVPMDGRTLLAEVPEDRLAAILEGALRATIVAEWVDDAGRMRAVARLNLFEGPDSLLALLLAPEEPAAPDPPETPLPALIVELRGADPVRYGLLPRLLLPDSEEDGLQEHWRCLARGVPPIAYAPSLGEALAMLQAGQPAVVLYGVPDPESGIDIRLDSDSAARLEAAHTPFSLEAIDRVILTLAP